MTNPEVVKLYRDTKFYGKVERLAIGWWTSNAARYSRDLGFMDYEDLMSEGWTHLIKNKKDGQTQAYYLQAIKLKFNDLLKKAKRRNEIAPMEVASRAWKKVDGEWVPVEKLLYSSGEGDDEKSEIHSLD